ncbi:MAG: HAD hydrolase family protein [Bacilli bacterium]|nr:HAD hydrolase family protein [Bacilli bacterium]
MNLIVSDFDGTFFDEYYNKNIELIKKYNIDFVIATGRNIQSLKKDLKIDCKYYICNDGGYILDDNYNLIYRNYINKDTIQKLYSRIIGLGYDDYFFDNLETFSKEIIDNINKLSIKIKDNNAVSDMEYILKDLEDVYAYISTNWINIMNIESKKENAIEYISKLNNYDKIIVVGNEINDYEMLKKYDGYLISKENNKVFKTINNFLEIETIIKNDH